MLQVSGDEIQRSIIVMHKLTEMYIHDKLTNMDATLSHILHALHSSERACSGEEGSRGAGNGGGPLCSGKVRERDAGRLGNDVDDEVKDISRCLKEQQKESLKQVVCLHARGMCVERCE